ncbi:WD40 repeat domain-containing protein [Tuwongella immobilis]|uniref:Uncharacterized protein n=1 Tax=Tuwongella immobilis TaxID=692036 RepID=A0A6C2YHK9_9BACT|nr:hypothetical protein [Tuwongella immobilis]VIP00976.1 wd-40 repeat-containing protein : Uncharacterized protein OS=Pseudogymnoascus pannorum VKM F-4246 GN=V492_00035 PE=4 SV=1: WD40: WD40: WD40: WD40: WD40: WD40: WD40: WD40: WD40: WD40: WD40: WD40: WD40: WD40 [Tuwongella immobilis]VTR97370.1 wd-40 repeat-containing protein : Uncharacterized protein OS=Pseudogymnoascus pannorum VKM F-4246 GN=V492_00035 PE=4 SV=1: WD40: WD40: WD40: WD40: WD40: WD40: WD40: WD40: WD40: WD40: WD40: WD40: WD40: WD40
MRLPHHSPPGSTVRRGRWLAAILLAGLFLHIGTGLAQNPPTPNLRLIGHDEAIYSTAVTPDGSIIATGSFDKTIRLWDRATGAPLRTYYSNPINPQGHTNLVLAVAISPDGKFLASAGSDNQVRYWNLPDRKPQQELALGHPITGIAVSNDGKLVSAAGSDGTAKVWNANDMKPIPPLVGHVGPISGVALAPNNSFLTTAGTDGVLRFWAPTTGQALGTIGTASGPITAMAISPNSNPLYTASSNGKISVWQTPLPTTPTIPPLTAEITAFGTSNDGNLAIVGTNDRKGRLLDLTTGNSRAELPELPSVTKAVAIAANGQTLFRGTADGTLQLLQADAKPLMTVVAHSGGITSVQPNPGGNLLWTGGADGVLRTWQMPLQPGRDLAHAAAVTGHLPSSDSGRIVTIAADHVVRVWRRDNGGIEREYRGHTAPIRVTAISNNSEWIASVDSTGSLRLWNFNGNREVANWSVPAESISSMQFSPGNDRLLTIGSDRVLRVWKLPGQLPQPWNHPDLPIRTELSSDGNRLITLSNDQQIRLWNLTNGQIERTVTLGGQPVAAIGLATDGVTMGILGNDRVLRLFKDGAEQKKFPALTKAGSLLTMIPNPPLAAVGGTDASITLISLADGKEIRTLNGHTGTVRQMLLGPNGTLLTGSDDGTIRHWKLDDGPLLGSIPHDGPITAMQLSRDGKILVAASRQKTVIGWTLADRKPTALKRTLPGDIDRIALSADASRIAVSGPEKLVRILDAEGTLLEQFPIAEGIADVQFRADGQQLFVTAGNKQLRAIPLNLIAAKLLPGDASEARFLPNRDAIVIGNRDGTLLTLDGMRNPIGQPAKISGKPFRFALSSDGQFAVCGSADGSLDRVQLADGKVLQHATTTGEILAISSTNNAERIAITCRRGEQLAVELWDMLTGTRLLEWSDLPKTVTGVSITPDGRTLLVSGDNATRIRDTLQPTALAIHPGGITSLAVHPNGSQLLTAGADKVAVLRESATLKPIRTFGPFPDAIAAVTFSRDGAAIAIATGKQVRTVILNENRESTQQHPAQVLSVAFTADRKRLLTGSSDNLGRIWELATNEEIQTISHGTAVLGVAAHSNQQWLITASSDRRIQISTSPFRQSIVASDKPITHLIAPSNSGHLFSADATGAIVQWNSGNGNRERAYEGVPGPIVALAVHRNSQSLAAVGADSVLRIYHYADGQQVGTIPLPTPPMGKPAPKVLAVQFHPNNPVVAASLDDGTILAWKIPYQIGQPLPEAFGKPIQQFEHPKGASILQWLQPDTLVAGGADGIARAWRISPEDSYRSLNHPNIVDCLAFSPDGKQIVTGCHDGLVRIWDAEKGQVVKEIKAHLNATMQPEVVYGVAWSPDGKQVVSASFDRSLKLWDVASGNLVREFKAYDEKTNPKGHREAIFAVVWTADGKSLISGSSDRTIRVWNVADGTVQREFVHPGLKPTAGEPNPPAHPGWINQMRLTRDGQLLVVAGLAPKQTGHLTVWRVVDGKLVGEQAIPEGPAYGLSLTPDDQFAIVGLGVKPRMTTGPTVEVIRLPGR